MGIKYHLIWAVVAVVGIIGGVTLILGGMQISNENAKIVKEYAITCIDAGGAVISGQCVFSKE